MLEARCGRVDHPRGHRGVVDRIDEDERSRDPVLLVGVEHEFRVSAQRHPGDVVEPHGGGGRRLEGVDVDKAGHLGHPAAHALAPLQQQVVPARRKLDRRHPHQRRRHLTGPLRRPVEAGDDVAAADVDRVGRRDGHGPPRPGRVEIAVEGDDPLDGGDQARRLDAHLVAGPERSRADGPRESSEPVVGPDDHLHRQPQRGAVGRTGSGRRACCKIDIDLLQVLHQAGAAVPRHVRAALDDAVAAQGRHRDAHRVLQPERPPQLGGLGRDRAEAILVVADEVHLVDRHHHRRDAEQAHDQAVATGLGGHAPGCVHEEHSQIRVGGARHHVAGVLLVAGRVSDDEASTRGREVEVGDVDGDSLLPLRLEAVGQQGQVDLPSGVPGGGRVLAHGGQMVVVEEVRVVQEPPDERRLAVIHRAAREQAQEVALRPPGGHSLRRVHQK